MSNFNIDHQREGRIGFPEIVFGASKDINTLKNIINHVLEKNSKVLITKLQPEKYEILKNEFRDTFYDLPSGIMIIGKLPTIRKKKEEVGILSGGTSDEFVVNEAFYTLSFLGIKAKRYIDVGAAGVHRLTEKTEQIKTAKVLIVCAGFEGALPTVVGGLFPQPIIAVPVSVGYGVAKGGKAALNAMLSSCANGLTVTNIDNGYGAAIAAYRILNINKK
ncbi:MAG: nickel pincer cofactor biosynthesis protein LarB [Melioribacteraceae bacterium]|nr:nickel pincer cofactor biosynthesis protein LarB [Melioribacteraceae bacterium]MCF8263190.1 nickel pincer cofactor biosynthesis protein LarB [Melioribacteraceae bacterium]MCF8430322.1 nickel pincer cofactor biosynthesis protein LarB [Melioribacteraceae bacterium]